MNDEELEQEADARARRLIVGAWTTEARPGQRAKVLAAMDAAPEARRDRGQGSAPGGEARTKCA